MRSFSAVAPWLFFLTWPFRGDVHQLGKKISSMTRNWLRQFPVHLQLKQEVQNIFSSSYYTIDSLISRTVIQYCEMFKSESLRRDKFSRTATQRIFDSTLLWLVIAMVAAAASVAAPLAAAGNHKRPSHDCLKWTRENTRNIILYEVLFLSLPRMHARRHKSKQIFSVHCVSLDLSCLFEIPPATWFRFGSHLRHVFFSF